MDVFEFANKHLGQWKQRGEEIVPKYCPYCFGGAHHDKETFALNINKLTFNCKRGSCGRTGTFQQLCRDFGEKADSELEWEKNKNFEIKKQPKKVYKKPTTTLNPVTKTVEEYLSKRGFSRQTWEQRKVSSDDKGNIIFPYYENRELVLIKFRPAHKIKKGEMKSWREEGGKPVLWGMDDCNPAEPLVIVEGEMDALALDEAGIKNVVSVPSGAEDLTWIETCWDWLQQFKKIIIWGDQDEPGQEMVRKVINRLGEYRCYVVQGNRKDPNETLYFDGKEKVRELINNAKEVPISGLLRLADVENFDYSKVQRVSSGIALVDKAVGGFMMGQVSVWTGSNSSGKSTFLGQLLIESIDKGFNVCAFSGELPAPIFRYWIELQMAGKDNLAKRYDEIKQADVPFVPKEIQKKMRNWYRDKFFLYDNSTSTKAADILRTFRYAAMRYDCKVFLIDNLMMTDFTDNYKDFYHAQSEFIGRVVEFAHKFDVHVHVVAHPRKTNGNVSKNDISGSGDISNRADNVFSIARVKEDDEEIELRGCDTRLDILKNRFSGKQDITIGLKFEAESKRFYEKNDVNGFMKQYGWNKLDEQVEMYEVYGRSPWDE